MVKLSKNLQKITTTICRCMSSLFHSSNVILTFRKLRTPAGRRISFKQPVAKRLLAYGGRAGFCCWLIKVFHSHTHAGVPRASEEKRNLISLCLKSVKGSLFDAVDATCSVLKKWVEANAVPSVTAELFSLSQPTNGEDFTNRTLVPKTNTQLNVNAVSG